MLNKLPNIVKYLLLTVVAVLSLVLSASIYSAHSSNGEVLERIKKVSSKKTLEPVVIETEYNLENGYVDIYINSKEQLSLLEIVFTKNDSVSLKSLTSAELFADYLKSDVAKSIRVAGTGGPNSETVTTTDRELFARIELEGLSALEDLKLEINSSSAITPDDKVLKVVEL